MACVSLAVAGAGLACGGSGLAQNAGWNLSEGRPKAERDQCWKQDLKQLATELPKLHKNLYFSLSEAEFRKGVSELDSKIPKLNDAQVVVELSKLVARVGDGHTLVQIPNAKPAIHRIPFEFAWLSDGLFVTAAANYYESVGMKLTKIGDEDAGKALNRIAAIFPQENESTLRSWMPRFMNLSEVLFGLGLSKDPKKAQFTFEGKGGKTLVLNAAALEPGEKAAYKTCFELMNVPTPFRMSKRGAYWSATIPGTNILYIQYSECVDAPDLPMKDFARKMAEFIDQLKIEKVIVDLRFNGGGNSEVARPLIDVLKNNKQINQKGNLFVLIGRGTFSSAVINAQQLRTETAATLVGEGTGQKPNHYGEMKTLHLKNSGLPVTYSTKYFKFTEKDEPSMMPDVAVTASSEDFFSGRDPGIEAAVGRPAIR